MSKAEYKFLRDWGDEFFDARHESPVGLVRCTCHVYTGIATEERVDEYTEFTVVTQTDYHIGDVINGELGRSYPDRIPWYLIRCSGMERYCGPTIVSKRVYNASKE